jgi:hypothetical protein
MCSITTYPDLITYFFATKLLKLYANRMLLFFLLHLLIFVFL